MATSAVKISKLMQALAKLELTPSPSASMARRNISGFAGVGGR
jgi:hypothetical protein